MDKKEVEVLKRASENFVRRDRVLTRVKPPSCLWSGHSDAESPSTSGASTGSSSSASVHRSTEASETSWA